MKDSELPDLPSMMPGSKEIQFIRSNAGRAIPVRPRNSSVLAASASASSRSGASAGLAFSGASPAKARVVATPATSESVSQATLRTSTEASTSESSAHTSSGAFVSLASRKARANRPLLFATEDSLSYLDGTLPGDYGFDPLRLFDPGNTAGFINQPWLQYAEVMNGRWAMLGVVGCLTPEYLAHAKIIPKATGMPWFTTGFLPPAGTFHYYADPYALFAVQVLLMQFVELQRLREFNDPGSIKRTYLGGLEKLFEDVSDDPVYPGGSTFDPLGLGQQPKQLVEMKLAEIKHGRLAMLAMFGFGAQAVLTRKGPYDNFVEHVSDPLHHNMLTNFGMVFGELKAH